MKEAGFTTRATSPISVVEGRVIVNTTFDNTEVKLVFECPACKRTDEMDIFRLEKMQLVGNDILAELQQCDENHVFAIRVMER